MYLDQLPFFSVQRTNPLVNCRLSFMFDDFFAPALVCEFPSTYLTFTGDLECLAVFLGLVFQNSV